MDQKLENNNLMGANLQGQGQNAIRPPLPNTMRPPAPIPPTGQPGQRPPMPSPSQIGQRPPPLPGRPPMPNNSVRPPMPPQTGTVRPPMPPSARPMAPPQMMNQPPRPINPQSASQPQIPTGSPQRPQMPMRPPIPSPSQNARPPMPMPGQQMRPPIPSPGQSQPGQPVRPPLSGAPMPQQSQTMRPPVVQSVPSMPAVPSIPSNPVVPSITTVPSNPAVSAPFSSPPMPQPQVVKPPMPSIPPVLSPNMQRPPLVPNQAPIMRPPMPSASAPLIPPMPGQASLQSPPGNIVRPPMPAVPQMPSRPQIPTVPQSQPFTPQIPQQASFAPPSMSSGIQRPSMSTSFNPLQQHQQHQQPYTSQHGFPHSHSGQTLPGAPQSISSNSHSMKEFYDEYDPLIKPNIHSDYLSCSIGKVPRNSSLLGKARIPFGLTVSFYPYGDSEKDKVAEVSGLIVRCRRCRTYLNPFAELIEQGSRWRCNICYLANEFPPNYDFDPVLQRNVERKDHVELNNFVYDFTNAPIEYTVRPPQPPVFLFALEVTAAAIQSGLFAASCRVIQEQLDAIPNEDGRARVALLTFDQRIQFYKMTPNEPNAKVLVVADAGEPFLPACSDLLVNLAECRSQLDSLLDQLPQMYSAPSKSSSALGPVLQSAHMLLKSIGGKIVVICASLPTQFEGALKPRDDQKLMGTPKESTLLQPANQFYKLFASEVVKDQICVDLFVAPPQLSPHVPIYTDIATISALTKYTGGKLYYYPEFGTGDAIAAKFCSDLRRFLGQDHGFEAVLRIRASQGISLSAYHGSFFLRQTDLLSLPNVNPDHSFSAQASIDENLQGAVVCFQAALLHTTSRGERRIRVINFSAPVTDDIKEVFSNMNVNGVAGVLAKMGVEKVLANRLEDAREAVLNKCADVIAAFKTQFGLKTNPNLLLSENLKNLPILLHSLVKSVALRAGSITHPDTRSYYLTLLKTLSVKEIVGLLLPRFYAIHSMDSECGVNGKLPNLLNLSAEKLERHGIFLLDNGLQQFLWIGSNVHPELLQMLFGTSTSAQIPSGRTTQLIPNLDNDWNRRVHAISDHLCTNFSKNIQPEFFIVKEESEPMMRQLFMTNLIEDRSVDGSAPSYAQWLMEVTTRVNSSSY